jgi:hypothetical protein
MFARGVAQTIRELLLRQAGRFPRRAQPGTEAFDDAHTIKLSDLCACFGIANLRPCDRSSEQVSAGLDRKGPL